MSRVIVTIQKNGEVSMKVEKVIGKDCLKVTKTLENSLGETCSKELTSEFYQQAPNVSRTKVEAKT